MSKSTTKAEREEWDGTDWCPDDEGCFDEAGKPIGVDGITLCANEVIDRLIADVERLKFENKRMWELLSADQRKGASFFYGRQGND